MIANHSLLGAQKITASFTPPTGNQTPNYEVYRNEWWYKDTESWQYKYKDFTKQTRTFYRFAVDSHIWGNSKYSSMNALEDKQFYSQFDGGISMESRPIFHIKVPGIIE